MAFHAPQLEQSAYCMIYGRANSHLRDFPDGFYTMHSSTRRGYDSVGEKRSEDFWRRSFFLLTIIVRRFSVYLPKLSHASRMRGLHLTDKTYWEKAWQPSLEQCPLMLRSTLFSITATPRTDKINRFWFPSWAYLPLTTKLVITIIILP